MLDDQEAVVKTAAAVVHMDYDLLNPPPVPSPDWTRFVCISDTHSRTFPVPPGDVLLHSGDLTKTGLFSEFQTTVAWLRDLPHPIKIFIAGNHDLTLDQHNDWYDKNFNRWHRKKQDVKPIRELLTCSESTEAGLVYLEDQQYEFRTKPDGKMWSVYGSPWSPEFCSWAFNYDRGLEADKFVKSIPKVDILLTHGPPSGVLDRTIAGTAVGCEALTARLPALQPRLHVFGHIHEAHGSALRRWGTKTHGAEDGPATHETVHINAANWPAGQKSRVLGKGCVAFGTGPFQPIIVDLLDNT